MNYRTTLSLLAVLCAAGCATVDRARDAQEGRSILEGERILAFAETGLTATNGPVAVADLEAVALRASPTVFQARQAVILAQIAVRDVKSSYIPTLDAAAGYTYTAAKVSKEADSTHDGAFGGQASLNMLVYDFGRTRASTRRAINALVSAERDARTAENATRYAVRSACYALRRTEELRDVAAEMADIYAQHKKQMQDRYDVGAVNSYAVTKASVDWSQAVLEAVTASNSVLTARAGLNHALGLADAPDFAITDSGIRTYEGLGIEELIGIARTNAPALASLRAAAEGASDYVDYTVANLYPSLGISIQYQATYDDSTLLWNLVGAGQLSQSNFCAGRKRRAIDAAVAQLRIARAAVSAEELSLRNEITKAVLAAIRAQQQFDVAVETRKMAEENYRIVAQRYDVGKASELERSDAQVAVSSAKAAVVAAKYDYFDSQILISRLIGE